MGWLCCLLTSLSAGPQNVILDIYKNEKLFTKRRNIVKTHGRGPQITRQKQHDQYVVVVNSPASSPSSHTEVPCSQNPKKNKFVGEA